MAMVRTTGDKLDTRQNEKPGFRFRLGLDFYPRGSWVHNT